jgi:cobaltochelatase CobS
MAQRVHIIEAPNDPKALIVATDEEIRTGNLPPPIPVKEGESLRDAARALMEKMGGSGRKPKPGEKDEGDASSQEQSKSKEKSEQEKQQDTDNLFKLLALGVEPNLAHLNKAQIEKLPEAPKPEALSKAIVEVIKPIIGDAVRNQPPVDEAAIRKLVNKVMEKPDYLPAREIILKSDDQIVEIKDRQHYLFPMLLKIVSLRLHPYLVGPAGSGKTHTAEAVSKALKLSFSSVSVCAQSTEYLLKGYFNAHGQYVRSLFREAYENGGVFLIDEIDAGNPNIVACLNAALSNCVCAFPDKMVAKHKDFVCIAAANTWGTGASREYVGRNPLDAATLDRFVFLDFKYDSGLEAAMVGIDGAPSPALELGEGGSISPQKWIRIVQVARDGAVELGLRQVISPRATLFGAKLSAAGIGKTHLEKMLIYKGLEDASARKLSNYVNKHAGV